MDSNEEVRIAIEKPQLAPKSQNRAFLFDRIQPKIKQAERPGTSLPIPPSIASNRRFALVFNRPHKLVK